MPKLFPKNISRYKIIVKKCISEFNLLFYTFCTSWFYIHITDLDVVISKIKRTLQSHYCPLAFVYCCSCFDLSVYNELKSVLCKILKTIQNYTVFLCRLSYLFLKHNMSVSTQLGSVILTKIILVHPKFKIILVYYQILNRI